MKITIASGKGGTGKTTIATNLATFLAESARVVLTDLDVEEPNSGLFMELSPISKQDCFKSIPEWNQSACTLCGKCQTLCVFNAILRLGEQILVFKELCHSCFACSELCQAGALPMQKLKMGEISHYSSGKLSFVEGRLEIGQEQAVPLIASTLGYVNKHFDNSFMKIYDAPPGTSCPVIKACSEADLVILVTEPSPFGLHDLKLAVATLREMDKELVVVINRAGAVYEDLDLYCQDEKLSVVARFPNDRAIAEYYSQGHLIYPYHAGFMDQLQALASYV
ncbi:MAG: ATP-binding protein, partial [Candidatus Cloacimonadaceae bacterium]|nr:ATP-binding protein [Candidatus Cloacimonadaceae bacterium]